MKATVLFWVHSIAALVFGLAFLLFPEFMSDFLAVPTNTLGTVPWRFFGLAILAFGGIAFGSRNKTIDEVRYPIILVFFVLYGAMVVLKILLILFNIVEPNIWMWGVALFHLVMTAWYGACLFARKS